MEATADNPGFQLGMSSFNATDRNNFGESVRLAMACIEGRTTPPSSPGLALPSDSPSIALRLQSLSENITASQADLLELLVRFDDLKGWQSGGARHCAAWMNLQLGINLKLGWEYLRVGRRLRDLPVVTALFRAGKLSWSKVRLLSRVADADNESLLCHAALDASVSDVERLCHEYRWQDDNQARETESTRALQQWESRSLRWDRCSNGSVRISLTVPPEIAQAFLNSVEYSLGQLESSDESSDESSPISMSQKRADAAILMAENNLQSAGQDIATADRYQVIVSVDAAELRNDELCNDELTHHEPSNQLSIKPNHDTKRSKRATILGAGADSTALAKDTVRRLTCDCSVSTIINNKWEPINIGQKSRVWPTAMARAIKARDKQCIFPGCSQSRHLHIHHRVHWADGGSTCLDNGVCLCAHHHTLVHEGGYRIERVNNHEQRREEQFKQQTITEHASVSDVERTLRNSVESFDQVRRLSPERFRFRVIDRDGNVVSEHENRQDQSTRVDYSLNQKLIERDGRLDEFFVEEPAVPRYALVAAV